MAGNPKMSRAVGNALHKNPDPENIPCFRVLNSKGELAGAFAFGGEGEQATPPSCDKFLFFSCQFVNPLITPKSQKYRKPLEYLVRL